MDSLANIKERIKQLIEAKLERITLLQAEIEVTKIEIKEAKIVLNKFDNESSDKTSEAEVETKESRSNRRNMIMEFLKKEGPKATSELTAMGFKTSILWYLKKKNKIFKNKDGKWESVEKIVKYDKSMFERGENE